MFGVTGVAFLAVAIASPPELSQGTGTNVALSQRGVNYVRDKALPILVDYLANYDLPNPIASGKDYSIKWSVKNVALSNLGITGEVDLVAPGDLDVHLDISSLEATAKIKAKESVWPHPSVSAHAHAKSKGSHATMKLRLDVDTSSQIPSLTLSSCSPSIALDISISGLGILDKIADHVAKSFRGDLEKAISSALCKAASSGVSALNEVLADFGYQQRLPSSLASALIDFHLTAPPNVVTGPPLYLQAPLGSELLWHDGSHFPVAAPRLPELGASEMGSRMAVVQVSPFPVNTGLIAAQTAGLLQYDVHKDDLGAIATLLTTDYWGALIPEVAARFNTSTDMLIRVGTPQAPMASLAHGNASLTGNVTLEFIALSAEGEVPVFALQSPVNVNADVFLSDDNTSITGQVSMDDVMLSVAWSKFGDVPSELGLLVSPLLSGLLQQTAIPKANAFIAQCYTIPYIKTSIGDLSFSEPELHLSDGYLLVGTDVVLDLKPGLGVSALSGPSSFTQPLLI